MQLSDTTHPPLQVLPTQIICMHGVSISIQGLHGEQLALVRHLQTIHKDKAQQTAK